VKVSTLSAGAAWAVAGVIAAFAMPFPALAGSAVTPTLVRLASPRVTGEVTLWNGGTSPMLVEASAVTWTQANGRDTFAATDDFVIAPALVEVQPGSGQIFRVRARVPVDGHERTYRLRLEDITPAQPGTGVGMRIRHDLPLILAVAGSKPELAFGACPDRPAACLRVTNRGTALAKITGLVVASSTAQSRVDAVGTVLAGSWREWTYTPPSGSGPLRVRAETPLGPVGAMLDRP